MYGINFHLRDHAGAQAVYNVVPPSGDFAVFVLFDEDTLSYSVKAKMLRYLSSHPQLRVIRYEKNVFRVIRFNRDEWKRVARAVGVIAAGVIVAGVAVAAGIRFMSDGNRESLKQAHDSATTTGEAVKDLIMQIEELLSKFRDLNDEFGSPILATLQAVAEQEDEEAEQEDEGLRFISDMKPGFICFNRNSGVAAAVAALSIGIRFRDSPPPSPSTELVDIFLGGLEVPQDWKKRRLKQVITDSQTHLVVKVADDKDIISQLPNEILVSIIARMSLKAGARTSLLSKRWRNLHKLVTNINISCADLLLSDDTPALITMALPLVASLKD